MESKKPLLGAVATLICGILSILTFLFFIGIIFGITGLVIFYRTNPYYDEPHSGYSMLKFGRILSFIGLGLSIFEIIYWISLR
jgi:hypothetical protein